MKKIEALKQLKETIKHKTLVTGNYTSRDHHEDEGAEPCHCVVGYLLQNGGLSTDKLLLLDNRVNTQNPYDSYMIGDILHNGVEPEKDFVKNTLVAMGFEFDLSADFDDSNKLRELQEINDNQNRQTDTVGRLVDFINEWIGELENNPS